MKIAKIILYLIVIIAAILDLMNMIPFDIASPMIILSFATLLLLQGIEYKKDQNKNGFIIATLIAIVAYIFVIYIALMH